MQQTLQQESYAQLISMTENLIQSLNDLSMDELQNKVTEYIRNMENQFYLLKSSKSSVQNLKELKQLILLHENVTALFVKEKRKLSKKLKEIHAGKEMKNTYPGL